VYQTQESGVRLFIRDAIEGAIAAVSGLWVGGAVLGVPALQDIKAAGLVAVFAAGASIVATARRELLPLILDAISPKPAA
jgi:hypothetical protein